MNAEARRAAHQHARRTRVVSPAGLSGCCICDPVAYATGRGCVGLRPYSQPGTCGACRTRRVRVVRLQRLPCPRLSGTAAIRSGLLGPVRQDYLVPTKTRTNQVDPQDLAVELLDRFLHFRKLPVELGIAFEIVLPKQLERLSIRALALEES